MEIQKGFSFLNRKGKYYIEDGFLKFDQEEEEVNIYKDLIQTENGNSVFMEFASLDPKNESKILDFCNKYGRLDVVNLNDENDIYEGIDPDEDFTDEIIELIKERNYNVQHYEKIISYTILINRTKALLSLKEAIDSKNTIDILTYSFYLALQRSKKFGGPLFIKGYCDYTLKDVLERRKYPEDMKTLLDEIKVNNEYDFIMVKNILSILDDLCIDIEHPISKDTEYEISFGIKKQQAIDRLKKNTDRAILEFGIYILTNEVNVNLIGIYPKLQIGNNNQLLGYWDSPSLIKSMFMEIFLKFSQDKKIRKCRNRTCSNYFEIIGNDTRKIYCSTDCARLEAKRMERDRKKIKESEENGR